MAGTRAASSAPLIGQRLKALRRARGLSLAGLAAFFEPSPKAPALGIRGIARGGEGAALTAARHEAEMLRAGIAGRAMHPAFDTPPK